MEKQENKIIESVEMVLSQIPEHVILVAAAKTRTLEEVKVAVRAGVKNIGYNYVQEALPIINEIGSNVKWHMIGHLQTNKAKYVAESFDWVETIDSWHLAKYLDQRCQMFGKIMPVLIEINSGRGSNKTGVLPGNVDALVEKVSQLKNLKLQGLMTMGPRFGEPENSRPYFQLTRSIFDRIAGMNLPNVEMEYLSMGMSNSYPIAIEEGANIVRIGTRLFGERS